MLARYLYRMMTEVQPRLGWKAARLWVRGGMRALGAFRRRLAEGRRFPPFLFVALTNACNLRCHGCWIESVGRPDSLPLDDVDRLIGEAKRQECRFFTLLGGEPLLYPHLWEIIGRHSDCYFQVITNGTFFTEEHVGQIERLGNVTPLVSIDGFPEQNDARRGEGVFDRIAEGLVRLKRRKILYGVATTVTGANFEEVSSDRYVEDMIARGAMYLWYYVYRPVGRDPSPQFCASREQLLALRRRILAMRRRHPILLIDTYWNAAGEAVCPAAAGLGYHIGPKGSIEPCPPLSVACETIRDRAGDLAQTIGESRLLAGFERFVHDRTRGCVILERPQELAAFLREQSAQDYSGRDLLAELEAMQPRTSHHLPGEEIPEDYWLYRFLKKQMFFGMGAYG